MLFRSEKPDVDAIEGLSPAISIEQKTAGHNPRSTVGTVTEVHDYLRLFYARAGTPHCPNCGRAVERQSPAQIADVVLTWPDGTRIEVLAPLVRGRKGEFRELFESARKQGFVRAIVDGSVIELDAPPKLNRRLNHDVAIIVDRLRRTGQATFSALTRDCDTTLLVVARFLALLEIYRDGVITFDQDRKSTRLNSSH